MNKVRKKEWKMSDFLFHHEEEGLNVSWKEREGEREGIREGV
jgi:hypothetical protein